MKKPAVSLSLVLLPLFASAAYADEATTTTTTAGTVVVVSPNAPIVVNSGAPAAMPSVAAPISAPGAQDVSVAPAGPPQNEDWNNVSHINGQLVPVGEHTNYLYKFKKTNISSNPIGWMFGFYGISVSQALTQNVAIRFDANYWNLDNGNTSGYEVGISAPIYFRRTYSGPFIEPGLLVHTDNQGGYLEDSCEGCDNGGSTANTWVAPEMLFGWHWSFDSGLNIAAAFGASKRISNSNGMSTDSPDPAGYFRVGYEF